LNEKAKADFEEELKTNPLPASLQGKVKKLAALRKYVIAPGTRATTVIEAGATVSYSDSDGDGFSELATITVASTVTAAEIKLFLPGRAADPRWEIRPLTAVTESGGTTTITLSTYLLVDPDVAGASPGVDHFRAVDASNAANLLSTVDVYRVYNDSTQAGAQFGWEVISLGSVAGQTDYGSLTLQSGTFVVTQDRQGLVTPFPSTYTTGWSRDQWSEKREPDRVRLHYYSGFLTEEFKGGYDYESVRVDIALAVCWIATARLANPICGSGPLADRQAELAKDMSLVSEQGNYIIASEEIANSPFGTKVGEVMAYRRLTRLDYNILEGYAL